MSHKKITIAHLHVWDKKNKGDVGIVKAVHELLKKQFPLAKIINFPIHLLRVHGAPQTKQQMLKKINLSDMVVIGGGGIFYHWFTPYSKKVIQAIKKPIIIFGVGYIREEGARKLTPLEQKSIAFLVDKAKLVGVRDYYTKQFLIKNKIPAQKIKIIGDPAIFLNEKKTTKINLSAKVKIGLNLNYSGWLGFGRYENKIINSYNQVIKYFEEKYQARFYYCQHHPGEKIIKKKLKTKNLITVNLPPGEQKFIYSQLDLMIGMMLHSCVMAFGAGTPEINLAYDIRNKNFARFIGCPELVITPTELKNNTLLKKTITVFKNKERYQKKFKERKQKIWHKHQTFLNQIKKMVNCG